MKLCLNMVAKLRKYRGGNAPVEFSHNHEFMESVENMESQ